MSAEQLSDVIRREVAFWNSHDPATAGEVYADNFYGHDVSGIHAGTLEQLKQSAAALFSAFPDLDVKIEDLLVDGDKAVKRWSARGTHNGVYAGVPATGKEVVFSGTNIFRIVDGKITEVWVESDVLGFLRQLGVIPEMG
jgi:steroid delta-isomerase-like uncharacterized protein